MLTERCWDFSDQTDRLNNVPQPIAQWVCRFMAIALVHECKGFVRSQLTFRLSGC
jgi:hypothetical protein